MLVKPIKTVGSWAPHYSGVNHFLLAKTEAHVWAAAARVLGKADATVRRKVRGLDSADCALHQAAKLLTLFLRYGRAQVLNLDETFADEYDLRHFRNSSYPRVADELGIESK